MQSFNHQSCHIKHIIDPLCIVTISPMHLHFVHDTMQNRRFKILRLSFTQPCPRPMRRAEGNSPTRYIYRRITQKDSNHQSSSDFGCRGGAGMLRTASPATLRAETGPRVALRLFREPSWLFLCCSSADELSPVDRSCDWS